MCSTCSCGAGQSVGTRLVEEFLIIVHDVVDYHPGCHSIFGQPARCSCRQALGGLIFGVVKGVFRSLFQVGPEIVLNELSQGGALRGILRRR